MTLVRVIKNWNWPNLLCQTPSHSGVWEDITFTLDPVAECDYAIVLNTTREATTVTCPPEHVWSIVQEPPTELTKPWHINPDYSFRMFTTDTALQSGQYIQCQPALPWHINQDYDFLVSYNVPEKTRELSWVTSRLQNLRGHRARMGFLAQIQGKLEVDLIATYDYYLRKPGATRKIVAAEQAKLGFVCTEDKWDGLAPYRYSLAVENYSNPFYWSEKLADCYLAWCMPIYYGCTRITDYFPAESMIQIDIHQPDAAIELVQEAIASNAWQRNLDAIAHARELILNRYQFFPFLARQIRQFESMNGAFSQPQPITIAPRVFKETLRSGVERKTKRSLVRLLKAVGAKS